MADAPQPPRKQSPWAAAAKYSHIGFILPAAVFVGWLIGTALDRWLEKDWLHIAGILFGSVAGFIELIRVALRMNKE